MAEIKKLAKAGQHVSSMNSDKYASKLPRY